MSKLNGFILFMVLVNLSWAEESQICTQPGLHADDSNCQQYHECSSTASADGSLQLLTHSCPEREAFSSELNRCTRDISSCNPSVNCASKGVIPDPEGNTCYYICQPRFTGSGFHVFRVYCGKNETFSPMFGMCIRDIEHLLENGIASGDDSADLSAVRNDIQRMKKEYKNTIKIEKAAKKAFKRELQHNEEEAKSQAELLAQARDLELSMFKCETEGNFPSHVADYYYIACVNNNNILVAVSHQCSLGGKFDPQTATCV